MQRKLLDHAAVSEAIKTVYPRLWRYCLTLTGNHTDAQDLVQAACLRALEKIRQFDPESHFDRWIFTITRRMWLNELRSKSVRQGTGVDPIEEIELIDSSAGPESNILGREVLDGIMALPEAQRMAVLLVYAEGYSYKEASEVLEVPIGTVMSRLSTARVKLASQFTTQEGEG